MNQRLDADVRATILSLVGQAESIGQAVGGLLVGFLANLLTVPLALLSVSVLLMPVLGFIYRSNRSVGRKDI